MIELEEKSELITKPPTRWRNKYRAREAFNHVPAGKIRWRDEVYLGSTIWRSKDEAETRSLESDALDIARYGRLLTEYLGPVPVDENGEPT